MNEAETRAELIDPAFKAAGWGVVEGSRIRREVITLGRLAGRGQARQGRRSPTTCWSTATEAGGDRGQGVGRRTRYRRRGPGQELRGQAAVRFAYSTNGHGIYRDRHGDRRGRRGRRLPDAGGAVGADLRGGERLARPLRRGALRGQGRQWQARYYQHNAIENALEAIAAGKQRILLTLATGTGKTFIAFQIAWKLFHSRWNLADWRNGPRADPPAAHPVPGRPQHPGQSGVQRLLRLPGGRVGADCPGGYPQEGPGAEERQRVLHHLPDLHDRTPTRMAIRRPTSATIRRTSSTSSSSTSAIAAAPTTRATGAASWTTSRRRCSSASRPRPSARTTPTPTPTSASRSTSTRSRTASTTAS